MANEELERKYFGLIKLVYKMRKKQWEARNYQIKEDILEALALENEVDKVVKKGVRQLRKCGK